MKETESGLLIPDNTFSSKHLNLIKRDPMERLATYLEALIQADPVKGKKRAAAMWSKVADVVSKSFAPDVLPVTGEITKSLQNERIDKCVELVLSLADNGWVSTRIIDELPRIFFTQLREGETKIPKRGSWGVQEKQNQVELDYSQELKEDG